MRPSGLRSLEDPRRYSRFGQKIELRVDRICDQRRESHRFKRDYGSVSAARAVNSFQYSVCY